ncbi:hypothetical protein [Dyella sp.]|uniref:hypothetical protein n=1 Tax=Dyella sp. TaxID=1869338 RepID=UPI002ED6B48C
MKPAIAALLKGWAIVMACMALAGAGVLWNAELAAQKRAVEHLKDSSDVVRELQAQALEVLQLRAQAMADDPAFVDYVTQSQVPDPKLGGAVDTLSISNLLKERRHGDDIVVLLDAEGMPITSIGTVGRDHAAIQHDALVVQSISQFKPVQGVWLDDGDLLWVAISPLMRGRTPQGYLVVAARVKDAFFARTGRLARSQVALVVDPSPHTPVVHTGDMDVRFIDQFAARRTEAFGLSDPQGAALMLHGGTPAWITPIATSAGHAAVAAVDQQAGQDRLGQATLRLLLGVAVLGVFGLACVWFQWRCTWRPLGELAYAFDHDRSAVVRVRGGAMVRDVRDRLQLLLKASR